jgi:hypothetical protein
MSESPVVPRPIKETPVIHPDAFVAHWENEAYLRGRRTTPYLKRNDEIDPALFFAFVAFLCLMGGIIIMIMGDFVAPALIVGGSLIAAGAGCLALLHQTATSTPKKVGQLLMGEVIASEKIRGAYNQKHLDAIGIRYQFTSPTGKIIKNNAETNVPPEQKQMAPPPGSPVYIWYFSDDDYQLL